MPEPLAPFPGSPPSNGAHREIAPDPVPPPTLTPTPTPTADDAQGDPLFWERRFDDVARPVARGREARHGMGGWRERLVDRGRDLLADTRAGVVVLVLVAVVAGFVWYRMGAGGEAHGAGAGATKPAATTGGQSSATTPATATAGGTSAASASSAATGRIVVHVAGAVTKPGVVDLAAGARVIDAIEAVGGALPDGDLDRLNLAAKLTDGERVYVGKPGVADPGAGVAGTGGVVDGGTAGAPGAKVNLNTATQAQLEELPGVGPAFAQAILAERERRGGFTSVNDLRSVRGIGDKRFADLSPLVTV